MERRIGEMKPLEPMSDRQVRQELIDYILGKDWYVVDPLSQDQINAIAVEEIKRKWDMLTNKKLKDKWNNLIDKLRFKKQVIPGDVLKLEVKIIKQKGPVGVGEAIATVDGKVAAKGELTFAIV